MGEGVASVPAVDRRAVFRAAALWLAFLAPFFYLTYGTANWLASLREDVPNLAFGWEHRIPFLAWTIVLGALAVWLYRRDEGRRYR